jgi:hypothetical protein
MRGCTDAGAGGGVDAGTFADPPPPSPPAAAAGKSPIGVSVGRTTSKTASRILASTLDVPLDSKSCRMLNRRPYWVADRKAWSLPTADFIVST